MEFEAAADGPVWASLQHGRGTVYPRAIRRNGRAYRTRASQLEKQSPGDRKTGSGARSEGPRPVRRPAGSDFAGRGRFTDSVIVVVGFSQIRGMHSRVCSRVASARVRACAQREPGRAKQEDRTRAKATRLHT